VERVGDVIEKARGARGRQDRSGQEKVIDKTHLVEKLPHLVKLYTASKDASTDLSDGIKKVAEKSGLLASVVRKLVVAKASENFDEKKKEAEQLALMFDEVA
jgi:thiamine monophosphate kinase